MKLTLHNKITNCCKKLLLATCALYHLTCNTNCLATENIPDAKQPLKIKSSFVEFDDKKGIAIYKGNVVADQGSRHLTSEKLTIYRGTNNKIKLVIATGNPAHFQSQPDLNKAIGYGKANIIKYFPEEDKMDLIENATLEQDGTSIEGHFLTYFFQTDLLKAESSRQQRTTVILEPKSKDL